MEFGTESLAPNQQNAMPTFDLDFRPQEQESNSDSLSLLALMGDFPKPQTVSTEAQEKPATAGDTTPTNAKDKVEKPSEKKEEKAATEKVPDARTELKKDLPPESSLKDGDIIFLSSSAFDEAKAIQLVSNSPLTHCGVLFKEGEDWVVYEAAQPVKRTPLKDFHHTENGETYLVRRLKNADDVLDAKTLDKMHDYLKGNVGKNYDHLFAWGNDKMYCSELVWKAYYEASRVKVGEIKMVGDYDLSDPLVKKIVDQRYGKDVPITEPTIAPGGIYESPLLKTVK